MNVGEIFISLGFDVDDKKLKEFNDQIKTGLGDMLKLAAAAAGAVYAINAFVEGSVRSATALRNFSAESGDAFEGLQKWQVATVLTNSAASADQVTASFKAMSGAIADVNMGKGSPGVFAMLGVTRDAMQNGVAAVTEQLRANFQNNVKTWGGGKPQVVVDMMKSIGFDPAMLQALMLSKDKFEDKVRNRFLSPASNARLVELGNAISDLSQKWQLFKDQTSADWSPTLIKAIEKIVPVLNEVTKDFMAVGFAVTKFFTENKDQLLELGVIFGALAVAIWPVATALIAIAAAIDQIGRALRGKSSIFDYFKAGTPENQNANKYLWDKMQAAPGAAGGLASDAGRGILNGLESAVKDLAHWAYKINNPYDDPQFAMRGYNSIAPLQLAPVSQLNQTNHVSITGVSDPRAAVDHLNNTSQKNMDKAYRSLNNGVKF